MTADELFERFRQEMIGHDISFVRLVCNTLLLYTDGKPSDERGLVIWLEPPWHVSTPSGVVAGSFQAQGEGEHGATMEELNKVWEAVRGALLDRPISGLRIDERSRELTLTVAGEHQVRTFVSDPGTDHSWHIRDNATGLALYASPSGLEVHRPKA